MAPARSAVSSSYHRLASPAVTNTSATPDSAAQSREAASPGPVTTNVAAVSQ
jgi:hypothetical protein